MNAYFSRFIADAQAAEPAALAIPASLSIDEMFALYDALRSIKSVVGGFISQPKFEVERGELNPAGAYLDQLEETIGKASDFLAEAIELAKPTNDREFELRAEIMIRHELACESVASAATLIRQIYKQRRAHD